MQIISLSSKLRISPNSYYKHHISRQSSYYRISFSFKNNLMTILNSLLDVDLERFAFRRYFSSSAMRALSCWEFSFSPTMLTSLLHVHDSHISSDPFDTHSPSPTMRTDFHLTSLSTRSMTFITDCFSGDGHIFLSSEINFFKTDTKSYFLGL